MLGYTVPFYGRLSPADRALYRKYYCEGCHQLRDGFGLTGTLTVNYDMTFNTILLTGLLGEALEFEGTTSKPCVLCKHKADSEIMRKMAAYTLILAKWELYDDDTDKPSVKAKLASVTLRNAISKAVEMHPEYDRMVGVGFDNLRRLEVDGCKDARLMGLTFGDGLIGALRDVAGEQSCEDLDNLFRELSAIVYLMDCVDDFDEDFMEGTYNPLLPDKGYTNAMQFRMKNVYELTSLLNTTIGSLQSSYSKIRPKMKGNIGICDNIVYFGIPDSAKNVMMGSSSAKLSVKNLLSNRKERMSD